MAGMMEIFPILAMLVELAASSGTLNIRLVHYHNPEGKGENGNCCESYFPIGCGVNKCDPMFTICADTLPYNDGDCSLINQISGTLKGKNDVTFADSIGGMTNPVSAHFDNLQNGTYIRVSVDDDDKGRDDRIGKVEKVFPQLLPDVRQSSNLTDKQFSLQVEVSITCDPSWSGTSCSVFDYCSSYTCMNGGTCVSGSTGPSCLCDKKHKGEKCEMPSSPGTSVTTAVDVRTRVDVSQTDVTLAHSTHGKEKRFSSMTASTRKLTNRLLSTKAHAFTNKHSSAGTSNKGIPSRQYTQVTQGMTVSSSEMSRRENTNSISTIQLVTGTTSIRASQIPPLTEAAFTGVSLKYISAPPNTPLTKTSLPRSSAARPRVTSSLRPHTNRLSKATESSGITGYTSTTRNRAHSDVGTSTGSITSQSADQSSNIASTPTKVATPSTGLPRTDTSYSASRKAKISVTANVRTLASQTSDQTTPVQSKRATSKATKVTSGMGTISAGPSTNLAVKTSIFTTGPSRALSKGTLRIIGTLTSSKNKVIIKKLQMMALSALTTLNSGEVKVTLDSHLVHGEHGEPITEVTYTLTFANMKEDPNIAIDAIHGASRRKLEDTLGVQLYEGKTFGTTALTGRHQDNNNAAKLGIGLGVTSAVIVIVIVLAFIYRKKRHSDSYSRMGYLDESMETSPDQPAVFDNALYFELRIKCPKHITEISR